MKGLDHAFKLDELFRDVTATGARAWAPTSGQMPRLYGQSSAAGDEVSEEDSDDCEGDNVENITTQENVSTDMDTNVRKTIDQRGGNPKKKAKKVTAATKMCKQINRICDVVETRSSATSYLRLDKPGCSIDEVMELLGGIPECPPLSELYMAGTRLFLKRENREMFTALPNPIVKVAWLKFMLPTL